jgi:hypothetical protein
LLVRILLNKESVGQIRMYLVVGLLESTHSGMLWLSFVMIPYLADIRIRSFMVGENILGVRRHM